MLTLCRLCIIYKVINMLIYFEPSGDCDSRKTGLILAPLPARKRLWEANDEIAWKIETERDSKPESHTNSGSSSSSSSPKERANWEDWCAGMDGLGGLVMLAASLVE